MSSSPAVETGDVSVQPREQAASMSDVHPNFHFTEQPSTDDTNTRHEQGTKINTEHTSKEVSPSASPRIRISLKGDAGPSEPDSPASIAHDAAASTHPGDSNSASASAKASDSNSSQSIAPSTGSIPATTVNATVNTHHGSISTAGPTSLSRRPFSFRDVQDINEDSQLRVQSARVHHDEYDKKRTCPCCENTLEQDKKPEPDSKQTNNNNNTDANGKASSDKTKTSNGTSPASPSSSSTTHKKKKSSGGWGLCGLCIGFRNCVIPEDPEYRCEHGRPCTAEKHRHTKGC